MRSAPFAALLILASGAAAQDGGRLDWKGRGEGETAGAIADARRQGRPLLLFFSSDG